MPAPSSPHRRGPARPSAGGARGGVDDDPFVRLSDEDFERLRHDPAELAEELRFGAYWLSHVQGERGRSQSRALEVAAEAIEGLHQADADRRREAAQAERALHVADVALGRRRAADAPSPALLDQLARMQAQRDAYVDYAARLEHHVGQLRALLAAQGRPRAAAHRSVAELPPASAPATPAPTARTDGGGHRRSPATAKVRAGLSNGAQDLSRFP